MQSTSPADTLRSLILSRRSRIADRLESLVAIDSGSYDAAGVDAVGDALAALWHPLGFVAERTALPGFGHQLCLSRRFGPGPTILILGHLDTVWPRGMAAEWPFRLEDGIAHGPGVGDMKGGLVMAHAAVEALIEEGIEGLGEIRHVLVPDEELGSAASRGWIEAEALKADWVLVLEPGRENGGVVVGRGAVGALVVRAKGRSAHTVSRAEGASAVAELAAKVRPLEALNDPTSGDFVNIGILSGGDARQVVPQDCEMHVDLRARTDARAEALLGRIRAILTTPIDPRVEVAIAGGITRPAFPRDVSTQLYEIAAGIAAELGFDYPAVESAGGSDGSFAAALGRPTLDGLGPVCFDSCSRRECIPFDSLFDRAALMAALIATLCAYPGAPH
jgi:glutamate carboxypeptidase